MQITTNHLTGSLTEIELKHIEGCTQCHIEREKLIRLKVSANSIELVKPPSDGWKDLKKKIPSHIKTDKKLWPTLLACAASIFTVIVGGLVFNNYQLKQELDYALFVSKQLELQMVPESIQSFQQSQILLSIRKTDMQLINSKSKKEKLTLLKQRHIFMENIIRNNQGVKNEFSI